MHQPQGFLAETLWAAPISYQTWVGRSPSNSVQRTLFPGKQRYVPTLHVKKLSKESLWLAHYVILSRPRRLANLLSHGLPGRAVLERGPPASISDAFQRLFAEKILETNLACQAARRKLNWPQGGSASERSGR